MYDRKIYIEEYIPKGDRPCINLKEGEELFVSTFYDKEIQMLFSLFREPEWLQMKKGVAYGFEFLRPNIPRPETGVYYKVWERFNDGTVLLGDWDINTNDWFHVSPDETSGEMEATVENYIETRKKLIH